MTRILVATDDLATEQRIRDTFEPSLNGQLLRRDLATLPDDPEEAVKQLLGPPDAPEVLVLGCDLPPRRALALARQVDRDRPDVSVLLFAERAPALLEGALQAGVRDVVGLDADAQEVRRAIDHALDVTARRRRVMAIAPPPPSATGRRIVVVSPKGGSGKTTVCANLAVGLAHADDGGTVLVDLDVQFGDVASALHLVPEATWADVAKARDINATALKAYLTRHGSGLFALCAPEAPADGELVKPERVSRVLGLLADEFRNVVVDTSAGLDEHTLAALESSTDIVLVCSMDVPSVRSLRKEITTLDQLGMTAQRRHFVLNRADSRVGLEPADVEATVEMSVDVAIPSTRGVPLAMNQGIPLIESDPRCAAAKQMSGLVSRFLPERPAGQRGFLRRKKDQR